MRRALLRFFVLGAVLFAAERHWTRPVAAGPGGGSDDEVLFREALALGLDRGDAVVQRRLLQNMAFLESGSRTPGERSAEAVELGMAETDLVVRRRLVERLRARLSGDEGEPDEAELQSYLEEHVEDFTAPPLLRISQRYLGDEALPLPASLPPKSPAALAKLFGSDFAAAVQALPPGEWSAPLRSAYGLHLVRVEEITAPPPPELEQVRARVRGALLAERAARSTERALRELRGRRGGG